MRIFIFSQRLIVLFLLLLGMGGRERAEARSTLAARLASTGMVGPEVEQSVELFLHFFPGDGEAILRARVHFEREEVELLGGSSRQGIACLSEGGLEVDYSANPLGRESADTLRLELIVRRAEGAVNWCVEIYSSVDAGASVAHQVCAQTAIESPLGLQVTVQPTQVFAGEQVELQGIVVNADLHGRSLEQIDWEWPAEIGVAAGKETWQWQPALEPGQSDTLAWPVFVESTRAGQLTLRGRARSARLSGSPVPPVSLQVKALPEMRVRAVGGTLEVGRPGVLHCEWIQRDEEPLFLEALRLELGPAFEGVAVRRTEGGKTSVGVDDRQGSYVLVEEVGWLAPGQRVALELQVWPQRPGPFRLKGFARPGGRADFIGLQGGEAEVRVVHPLAPAGEAGKEEVVPTDLQLLGRALAQGLAASMDRFSLRPGGQFNLRPEAKSNRSWLVEDLLARALMQRGYEVRLTSPRPEEKEAMVMYYRLVDARVVYGPPKRGWKVWRASQQREVFGDLFLRVESSEKETLWVGRVGVQGGDWISPDDAAMLASGDAVVRTAIAPDNKLIERSLSAGILGGLFYIFFIL